MYIFVFSRAWKSLWICHVHISQRGTSFSSGTQTLQLNQLGRSRSPKMLSIHLVIIIGERERANLVVRLAIYLYIIIIYIIFNIILSNFRAHGHRRYPLFADTLHTCSIHIRNVKYKGQQLFRLYSRLSSCFLSKLTARYSDTIRVVGWQVTR